jgi:hypothetical protein
MENVLGLFANSSHVPSVHDFTRSEILSIRYDETNLFLSYLYGNSVLTIHSELEIDLFFFHFGRMVFGVMGCVGFCGSLFVIISFLLFPHLRSFNKSLILCLAIADILSAMADILSLGYFASHRLSFAYCSVQASIIQYAEISSFIWSLIISVYLYTSAVHNLPDKRAKSFVPVFLLVGFLLPVIPVIVLQIKDAFGNSTNGLDVTWYEQESHQILHGIELISISFRGSFAFS